MTLPEFSSLLASAERGRYLTPLKTKMVEAYDGTPIGRTTVTGRREGKVGEVRPCLSIFATCAPYYLERHTEEVDWTDGFMARFLTFVVEREREYDLQPKIDLAERARLAEMLRGYRQRWEDLFENTVKPCEGLTPEAEAVYRRWYQTLKARRSQKVRVTAQAALARAHAMALKTAYLVAWDLAAAAQASEWWIDAEAMTAAANLVEWHVESILSLSEFLSLNADMLIRRKVLDQVESEPTSLGKIIKYSEVGRKRRVLEAIDTLCEEGTIAAVTVEGGVLGPHYMRPA